MKIQGQRYLTKSLYRLALSCPTKLYYCGKGEYADRTMDDSFLDALAKGGFQVGELARHYFPGGHDFSNLDNVEAVVQTSCLLEQERVTIYEPAVLFQNLFIRIDILVKNGSHIDLVEVKAKSYDSELERPFWTNLGRLKTRWFTDLHDVAFQSYVLSNAYPELDISSFLMLANRSSRCVTDGLNQKIRISRSNSGSQVTIRDSLSDSDLEQRILSQVPVDDEVKYIHQFVFGQARNFQEYVEYLAHQYVEDIKIDPQIGKKCRDCEFVCSGDEVDSNLLDGYKECWAQALGWNERDFEEPSVLEIWDCRSKDSLIHEGKIKFTDLNEEDLDVKDDERPGLSRSQRQWLQVRMGRNEIDSEDHLDSTGLRAEMDSWNYPLHFIDFETTAVALPFTRGCRPYEAVAFQFSHHKIDEGGQVEHSDQYLNTNIGEFPNFEFIRCLRDVLDGDSGTIFRYGDHENTYLNHIHQQILNSEEEINDGQSLCEFIESISRSSSSTDGIWVGQREMVDLLYLAKRYYYNRETRGSNSIKDVFPAVLNSSEFLKQKYSLPIYGSDSGIRSLNFRDWTWVKIEDGRVIDPYRRLPKLFTEASEKDNEVLSHTNEIDEGGAAMTAYAMLQFTGMGACERNELRQGLLRYCELDTLAMAMIFEAWCDRVG